MVEAQRAAELAATWLHGQLQDTGLLAGMSSRLVGTRVQGWIDGFARAVTGSFGWSEDDRYLFTTLLYIRTFDGTPMGEQLGIECLQMAQTALPGRDAEYDARWGDGSARGAIAGRAFAAAFLAVADFRGTFAVAT